MCDSCYYAFECLVCPPRGDANVTHKAGTGKSHRRLTAILRANLLEDRWPFLSQRDKTTLMESMERRGIAIPVVREWAEQAREQQRRNGGRVTPAPSRTLRCVALIHGVRCEAPAEFVRLCMPHYHRQQELLREGKTLVWAGEPNYAGRERVDA